MSLSLVAFPTDTEPVWTCSRCDSILQSDKKHKERKNKSPSEKNISRIFPLGEHSFRGSEDKMAALYLNAGEELRPAHKQLGKPQSSKSYRMCPLFEVL